MNVAVLVPVLGRPERVRPLIESLAAASGGPNVELVFVVSAVDLLERRKIAAEKHSAGIVVTTVIVPWEPDRGDYARKINHAYAIYPHRFEWFFLGADDLRFHPGWLDAALRTHRTTGACVIGTNDLGNRQVTKHGYSTHSLVHTDYRECGLIDGEPGLLFEGYDHNFVDNELVETARARGTYAQAIDSVVEHLHPSWKKAEDDPTYRKGQRRFAADRTMFQQRRKLWA